MARFFLLAIFAICSFLGVGAAPTYGPLIINAVRNPHYMPNGPAEYAKALSKWGVELPKGLAKHVSPKGQSKFHCRQCSFRNASQHHKSPSTSQ
jgi:hypothetical protein